MDDLAKALEMYAYLFPYLIFFCINSIISIFFHQKKKR